MPNQDYVLIIHPENFGVLVTSARRLPILQHELNMGEDSKELCDQVTSMLKASFQLTALRSVAEIKFDFYYRTAMLVFEILSGNASESLEGYTWMSKDAVGQIEVHPEFPSVSRYLLKYKSDGPDVYADRLWPHSCVGWMSKAETWLKEEVHRLSKGTVVDVSIVASGIQGRVLRAETEEGQRFFMKGCNLGADDEVTITRALSKVMPHHFYEPLSINWDSRWMLLQDYGNPMSETYGDPMSEGICLRDTIPELVENVFKHWAGIQKESINHVDDLVRAGVPLLGPKELKRRIEEITGDVDWYNAQMAYAKREKMEQFDSDAYQSKVMSYFDKIIDQVSRLNLPLTLVHGDMDPRNIIVREEGKLKFFDFEGAVISCPFVDALSFCFVTNGYRDESAEELSVYFNEWAKYAENSKLAKALKAMNGFKFLIGVCLGYDTWKHTEECHRLFDLQEMEKSVLLNLEGYV